MKSKKLTDFDKRQMVKDDYNAIAEIYSQYEKIENYMSILDKFISSLSGNEVIDIGCGNGVITKYFSEKGLNVKGLDFSENLLQIAKINYPGIEFINCDLYEWKSDEKFDGIFSKDMLFHIPQNELVKVLKILMSNLKENGILFVVMDIPKVAGEQILVESLDERFKLYYHYMMPDEFEKYLLDAGFKIQKKLLLNSLEEYVYADGVMIFEARKN